MEAQAVEPGETGLRSSELSISARRLWTWLPRVFVAAIFLQAVFAGSMMSGADWARRAHSVNAMLLGAALMVAGIAALIALRGVRHGVRFSAVLLAMAALVIIQTVMGKLLAQGADLMTVHIPLGVALVGFAGYAAALGRRLGTA